MKSFKVKVCKSEVRNGDVSLGLRVLGHDIAEFADSFPSFKQPSHGILSVEARRGTPVYSAELQRMPYEALEELSAGTVLRAVLGIGNNGLVLHGCQVLVFGANRFGFVAED